MSLVEFISVGKSFKGKSVLDNLSFTLETGEFVCLVGANGSGKSTVFNLISGVLEANEGRIEKSISNNEISYVRQNYRETLFPWKSSFDNIGLPLKIVGEQKEFYSKKINDLVDLFGIQIDLSKYPYELSGGQQQQIAIVRGVVTQPKLLLLDEPFGALDYGIKRQISEQIVKYWEQAKGSVLLTTHDIDEGMLLADRILIITKEKKLVEVKIDLERPRNIKMLASLKFMSTKAKIIDLL